jgi:ribosome maturation factor RimP
VEYYSKHHDNPVQKEVTQIAEGLGYRSVEVAAKKSGSRYHISVIITAASGIGLKDCERVHKAIRPRLELFLDDRDLYVEVSSPGISRNLKSGSEFSVFGGSKVRIMMEDSSEWLKGTIISANEKEVVLSTDDCEIHVPYYQIRKAKLVDTQEENK